VGAEVADRDAVDLRTRSLRENDLTAVGAGADPSAAMDVEPRVALGPDDRLASVQAHADPDRARLQRLLGLGGRRHGVARVGEGDEEGVALRVDLGSAMPYERLPEQASVLGKSVGIPVAELMKEAGRALDVGEEKRHCAARKIAHPKPRIAPHRVLAKCS
jgi:hypothetical protein